MGQRSAVLAFSVVAQLLLMQRRLETWPAWLLVNILAWLLAEVLQRAPDAMFASEAYVHPCAAVLAQRFGHP